MASKQQKSYPLRLDPELSDWIRKRAKLEDRSLNAEINRLLRQAREAEQKEAA